MRLFRFFISLCVLLFGINSGVSTHASEGATGDYFLKAMIRPGYAEAASLHAGLGLQMQRHLPDPAKKLGYRLKATEVEDDQEDEQDPSKKSPAGNGYLSSFYQFSSRGRSGHDIAHRSHRAKHFSYLSSSYIALRVIRV